MADVATVDDLRGAIRARNRAEINRVAGQLLEQCTRLGGQWFNVAHVLVRNGEIALAVAAAERGVEEESGSAGARFQLAQIFAMVGRHEQAIALISAISADQLKPIERDHFLGTCALEMGDFDRARSAFERVVAAWHGSGATWLSLAALPASDDQALLNQLDAARPTIMATTPDSRARWHYAKGAILDRLGRTGEAFYEFAAGAQLVKSIRPYDADADRREAEMLAAEYSRREIDRFASGVRTDSSRPILVTGLPRSGTTLVEQILTTHSAIAGGGEMPFGSILTREIGGNTRVHLQSFIAANGADQLTSLYLHLGEQQFGAGQRFVDKGLGASRYLGLLASVLPQSRIIWLRRDPLDCAWSCFRTYFSQGIEWGWSLSDIAAHFKVEDRLYSHWRDVLGDRMLTVSYEEFAAKPEGQARRILDHLGLDLEPVINATDKAFRVVTTASVTQVRQPVYQSSVGSAQRYREHLKPFIEAYHAKASVG